MHVSTSWKMVPKFQGYTVPETHKVLIHFPNKYIMHLYITELFSGEKQ